MARPAALDEHCHGVERRIHLRPARGATLIVTSRAAKAAIEALRAVVPEVVVSEPPPQDLELQPMRKRIEQYGPVVAIAAASTWAVVHFVR
jgi:hypothetical protein